MGITGVCEGDFLRTSRERLIVVLVGQTPQDRLGEPALRALISPSFSTATPVSALTHDHPSSVPETKATADAGPEPLAAGGAVHSHAPASTRQPGPTAVPILSEAEQVVLGAPKVQAAPIHQPLARVDGPVPEDLSEASVPSIIEFTQFDSSDSQPAPAERSARPKPFHESPPAPSRGVTPMQLGLLLGGVFLLALVLGMWAAG